MRFGMDGGGRGKMGNGRDGEWRGSIGGYR